MFHISSAGIEKNYYYLYYRFNFKQSVPQKSSA